MVKGIPSTLDLGVAIIKIEWLDEQQMRIDTECDAEDVTPDGAWDDDGHRILLHKRLKRRPRYARQIYLHEIGHAALDLYHVVR